MFKGENYHVVQRNCNHFSETFATALILGNDLLEQPHKQHSLDTFPAWVNRLARLGTITGLNDGIACNVMEEARVAAGVTGKVGWNLTARDKDTTSSGNSQKKELSEKQKVMLAKLKRPKS